jgi:monoamine oxidase
MSRTPLFAAVKRAIAVASHEQGVVWPRSSPLTRRQMLRLSAAAAGATALAPVLNWSAHAKKPGPISIAIVGGGVAGLTAAYRLQQHGAKPTLFEASNRWGGRMFTLYDFYKGMFCELGGELVDSNHEDLQNLLREFGLETERLDKDDKRQDLYFFDGAFRTPKDLIDPKRCSGAFAPIATQIAEDYGKLEEHGDWSAHARELDNQSLKYYLKQFRDTAKGWVIDLLDVAYVGEYGLETEEQSSLNLVYIIGTELCEPFKIFGESDEAYRIKGGSSRLIRALLAALKNKIEMKLGYALTELDYQGGQIVMGFDAPGGAQTQNFDAVILALPFTKLRQVKGLDGLKLGAEKLKCIRELGMGQNAKIMFGTTSRVWRTSASDLPVPSNSVFLTDLGFQCMWDTSRAQQQPGDAGILTNYLGGKAAEGDAETALNIFRSGLDKMWPKMAESLDPDPKAVTSFFWSRYPYTLGSYASTKVGQYTTMLDVAGEPALDGRLQFAGEHTSTDFTGYMNGGVQSGNRAAQALVNVMALK